MNTRRLLITILSLTFFTCMYGQTITTYAGNGQGGYSGDGGPAVAAEFRQQHDITMDKAGNMYVVDFLNQVVRKIAPAGIVSTFAGTGAIGYSGDGGPATAARLFYPQSVCTDDTGNLYISDHNGTMIRKVDTRGIITTYGGNLIIGYSGDGGLVANAVFSDISGITFNEGNLYLADAVADVVRKVDNLGMVTTIAGTGVQGYSGDGGPAVAATLNEPYKVAVDAAGNVYVPDANNYCLRKIDTRGVITTIAGQGPANPGYSGDGGNALQAKLFFPWDVIVDTGGNVYIADGGNNVIRKINTGGIITTYAGNGIQGYSGDGGPAVAAELSNPFALMFDPAGNMFVSDLGNNVIRKITPCLPPSITNQPNNAIVCSGGSTSFIIKAVNTTTYQWQLNTGNTWQNITNNGLYNGSQTDSLAITGAAIGMGGYQYRCIVANSCGNIASQLDTLFVTQPPAVLLTVKGGVCSGDTLVVNTPNSDSIAKIMWYNGSNCIDSSLGIHAADTGITVAGGNGQGGNANQLSFPQGVFVDSSGNIYTTDENNYRVQKWAPGATAGVTVAGGNGVGAAANQLRGPQGVYVDGSGNVYVSDYGNYRVQKWAPGTTAGVTVAGGNGGGPAVNQFNSPVALWLDAQGNIYVADDNNQRVQKWAPGATSGTTVAGGNGFGGAANQLSQPTGVFVDGGGNVYVADDFNHRVQKWAPGATSGITVAGGNGPGPAANQLSYPYSLFVDKYGNVYVGDAVNNRVQKWAPGATSGTTVAGGNGLGSASNQLNDPRYVFVDANGNIYVADEGNNRIQKWAQKTGADTTYIPAIGGSYNAVVSFSGGCTVTTNAVVINTYATPTVNISATATTVCSGTPVIFTATATNGGASPIYQWQVNGIGAGTNSNTYMNSGFAKGDVVNCILTVNNACVANAKDTSNSLTITVNAKPHATLKNAGTNCLGDDTLIVSTNDPITQITWANSGDNVDTVIATDTVHNGTTVISGDSSGTGFGGLWGSFVDAKGNLYISDANNARILKFPPGSSTGITVAGGNGRGGAANQINEPEGMYVDAGGNVFVADWVNNRIQKWAQGTTTGTTAAGGNGPGNAANQLYWPSGVYGDAAGNIYISDFVNCRVQKWVPGASTGTTVAGNGLEGAAANELDEPTDVFVDGHGNIYVADFKNNRVQKWLPGATAGTTVAGGNGKGPAANQLDQPYSIFVDGSGDVYVTDWGNNRIQKWLPGASAGITVAGGNGQGSAENQLHGPYSLFVDGNGDIYVADGGNNRVQKWEQKFIIDTTYIPGSAGTYTAVVSNIAGCTDTTNAIVVKPSVTPSVSISAPITGICAGTLVNFTATAANGGTAPVYRWLLNGAGTGTNSSVYGSNSFANGDVVSCVLVSNAVCPVPALDTSNKVPITVSVPVAASVSITPSADTVCPGETVTFNANAVNGGPGIFYQWQVNGNYSGTNSPTYTNGSLANGDVVSCVITSNAACVIAPHATSNTVIITSQAAVTPSVAINATSTAACASTPLLFVAVPTNGGAAPAYQWMVNGKDEGTNNNSFNSTSLRDGDSINCIMTSSLGCTVPVSAPAAITVSVYPLPVVFSTPTLFLQQATTVCS